MNDPMNEEGAKNSGKSGAILMVALLVCFTAAVLCGAYVAYTMNSAYQTRRTIDYRKARAIADSAVEFGTIRLAEVMANQPMYPCQTNYLQNLVNAITFTNALDGYVLTRTNGQPAFRISVASDVITGVISNGSACRGAEGDYQFFTITAGARNPQSGVTAVLQKKVQLLGVYLIRFGVFYENDLEIQPGATMTFSAGPVHCNHDMYLGGTLTLNDRVTSHANIYARRKDQTNSLSSEVAIKNQAGANIKMLMGSTYVDSDYSLWMGASLSRWDGRVLSRAHGVPELRPPINATDVPYTIIQRPMTTNQTLASSKPYYIYTNSVTEDTEAERFVTRACLKLLVSNTTVYAWDEHDNLISTNSYFTNVVLSATTNNYQGTLYPGFTKTNMDTYVITTNTPGFYNLGVSTAKIGTNLVTYTNRFYDAREKRYVTPIDIYVDRLSSVITNLMYDINSDGSGGVATTNSPWRTNLVFITFATNAVFNNGLPVVRLRNAENIGLARGLSVISDKPLYVEGNFNLTNRFSTNNLPCMVGADAVTLLSTNWQDALSSNYSCAARTPGNTTYNTVIMTGNSDTIKGNSAAGYNGGLENVLRFLEDWSTGSKKVTYNGSIIDLWTSRIATNAWISPTSYYGAPVRTWAYDPILRHAAPPGMTRVYGMEELEWKVITWQEAGW
ncbi:MAG: hypothetical protein WCL49_04560 [bacterium]